MTIEEKIFAIWSLNINAVALVPTARFKVPGNWQKLDRPYVIQYPVAESPTIAYNGLQRLRIWEFYQLSVIADSYSSGKTVAEMIRTVFTGNIDGVQFFYRGQRWVDANSDTGVEHIAVEFKIAETLSA